jgi:hypothetical protein
VRFNHAFTRSPVKRKFQMRRLISAKSNAKTAENSPRGAFSIFVAGALSLDGAEREAADKEPLEEKE